MLMYDIFKRACTNRQRPRKEKMQTPVRLIPPTPPLRADSRCLSSCKQNTPQSSGAKIRRIRYSKWLQEKMVHVIFLELCYQYWNVQQPPSSHQYPPGRPRCTVDQLSHREENLLATSLHQRHCIGISPRKSLRRLISMEHQKKLYARDVHFYSCCEIYSQAALIFAGLHFLLAQRSTELPTP